MLQDIILITLSLVTSVLALATFVIYMKGKKAKALQYFQYLTGAAIAWTLYDFSYSHYPMAFYDLVGVAIMACIIFYMRRSITKK